MILFTKTIEKQLQAQYEQASDLDKQKVICKIFNPYGSGTWYILNQDPGNPDYLWAIVKLHELEIGSISKSELENIIVLGGLYLERDKFFKPMPAKEVWNKLLAGQHV